MEYINRELSWLAFNLRVLEQAFRPGQPLLEAARFLAITASNLDEFFMVRVASLKHLDADEVCCPSGMRAGEVLAACALRSRELYQAQYAFLNDRFLPALAREGVRLARTREWSADDTGYLRSVFDRDIFPVLTPRSVNPERPPLLANLKLYVAFLLRPRSQGEEDPPLLAVCQIHRAVERVRRLPDRPEGPVLVLAEDIVVRFGESLFPGHVVLDTAFFRLTRDADLGVDEQRDEDYLQAMREIIRRRSSSPPVRLEIQTGKPDLRARLGALLDLDPPDVYEVPGPLDLSEFMALPLGSEHDRLRRPTWRPVRSPSVPEDDPLWETLRARDILLHHPYESFEPVSRLLEHAALDPAVIAIKMTLYRTSGDSPIVRALLRAAQAGKHVVAVVELKARFDEGRNIEWAQALADAGAVVIHGIVGLKVHAKATLIVRRETGGIVRYCHLGTGNYNDRTAAQYTDLGYMTTREEIARDLALFFNSITGYSVAPALGLLAMAPTTLKARLTELIRRETSRSTAYAPGRILAKLNALVDPDLISLLYEASAAGVQIKLCVRGVCCLRPGVPGASENIRVVSIVDQFLEHTRIFYFHNGGDPEVFLSSADWMPRNLDRRVELMFPVLEEAHRERIIAILTDAFRDTSSSRVLGPDDGYTPVLPQGDEKPFRSQEFFQEQARAAVQTAAAGSRRAMKVRREAGGR